MAFPNSECLKYGLATWRYVINQNHRAILEKFEIAQSVVAQLDKKLPPPIEDEYTKQKKAGVARRSGGNIKPSSISSTCLRKIAYEYEGKEKKQRKITAKDQIILGIGGFCHNHLVQPALQEVYRHNCIVEAPVTISAEKYLGPDTVDPQEILTFGYCDGLVHIYYDTVSRLQIGVEIKSIKSGKTQYEKVIDKGPPDYHIDQVNCYMLGLNLDYMCFLYVQKNDAFITPVYVPPDLDSLNRIRNKIDTVRSLVKQGQLPEPKPGKFTCQLCDYKHVCPNPFHFRKPSNKLSKISFE